MKKHDIASTTFTTSSTTTTAGQKWMHTVDGLEPVDFQSYSIPRIESILNSMKHKLFSERAELEQETWYCRKLAIEKNVMEQQHSKVKQKDDNASAQVKVLTKKMGLLEKQCQYLDKDMKRMKMLIEETTKYLNEPTEMQDDAVILNRQQLLEEDKEEEEEECKQPLGNDKKEEGLVRVTKHLSVQDDQDDNSSGGGSTASSSACSSPKSVASPRILPKSAANEINVAM